MSNKYPNSVRYAGLKAQEVRQGAIEADYRRKIALDDNIRRLRSQQGYQPPPKIRYVTERVREFVVEPAVDLREVGRNRYMAMPFGPNAPLANYGHKTGVPVSVGDFLNAYGGSKTIDGEFKDVTNYDAAKNAHWARRVLQALGLFGKVSPWGRVLDVLDIGSVLYDQLQQYEGEEAHYDPPQGWTETLRCNPLLAGSALRDVSRAAWVHQCYIGQAVSNTYSTTHRHRILWGQSNPAGTLWSVKQSFEWPGTLPNDNGVMVFQPERLPINLSVNNPGVASIDAAYNKGTPSKTPLSVPYHLRAGRPNNMFFEQGYSHGEAVPQAGNQVTIIPPKGPPIVVTRPAHDRIPSKNVKEKKVKLTRNGVDVLRIVGVATEALDVLDCLHSALPPKYWAKGVKQETPSISPFAKNYFGKGDYRAPSPQEKARAVIDNFDKIKWVKAGSCLAQEQLEDFIVGKVSKKVRKNTKQVSPNRPFGWLVGPAI